MTVTTIALRRVVVCTFLLVACGDGGSEPSPSDWAQRASLPGGALTAAASFVVGDKLYVGTGLRSQYTNSFYQYDHSADRWTQVASLPAEPRANGIGFAIGAYGYAGLGVNCVGEGLCTHQYFNDLWRYDPQLDDWTRVADFPAPRGQAFASSFVIDGKAYVTGLSPLNGNELWEYEPIGNTWTQKAGPPGRCKGRQTAFSLAGLGYLGLGHDGGTPCDEFLRYDPFSDSWSSIATLPGPARFDATGFSGGDAPFVVGGAPEPRFLLDMWAYDPVDDSWTQLSTGFPGVGRSQMLAAIVSGRMFAGLGTRNSLGGPTYSFDDLWEYIPDR